MRTRLRDLLRAGRAVLDLVRFELGTARAPQLLGAQAVDGDVAGHAEQVGAGVDDARRATRLRRRPIRQAQASCKLSEARSSQPRRARRRPISRA